MDTPSSFGTFIGIPLSSKIIVVDLDKAKLGSNAIQNGMANIQFWGINDTWSGQNYGIPSGTYLPFTFVLGYLPQSSSELASVTLSGNPTSVNC